MQDDERMTGTVVSVVQTNQVDGAYGVIESDEGRRYVFAASAWYRDGSEIAIGARVSFRLAAGLYADRITSKD